MTTSPTLAPDDRRDLDPYRLPRHVLPRRYEVHLEPHLEVATFEGRVVIAVDIAAPTRLIVLNAVDLEIHGAFVDGHAAAWELDAETERLLLQLDREQPAGSAFIDISFRGTLNDKLRGFYRSTYADANGRQHVVATTQMQSTDCRRAFPSFDEPDFKAVFAVTLVTDPTHLAISNGPEISRVPTHGNDGAGNEVDKVAVSFADTMPMSSYLVAFVVGPLEATAPMDVDGVPLRIVHVPGKSHLTDFALDVGSKSLRWFVNYYGIPYPDAKIDMVALPDFAAGAMENVGCITYRESLLLVDPAASTQMEQQNVADVVSHELAHMWFGDLVTMKWWNGIWLNEAFATFMEVAAVDAYRPDWTRWTNYSVERTAAFETDSLVNTRSIEYTVRSPQDCEGMFDVLTYIKGGALLRMLEQYLGEERFRDGIRLYLTRHSYGNTETSDLWDAIEDAVAHDGGEPVRALMDSWIWQPGYPLVMADIDSGDLVLRQQRFTFHDGPPDATPQRWMIPIQIHNGGQDSKHLLDGNTLRVPLNDPEAVVVVNSGGHGFYRVAYSPELLGRLDRSALATFSTVERYALVDDSWSAVVAGRLSAADFVNLLASFDDERDFAVWQVMAQTLRACARLVDGEAHDALRGRVRALVSPVLADLGWTPAAAEGDLRGKLRGLLISLLATTGADDDARRRCRELFIQMQTDPLSVHPEVAAAAVATFAAAGDDRDLETLVSCYRSATTPQDRLRYLNAVVEFENPDVLRRACEFVLSDEVKTQDAPFVLARALMSRANGPMVWEIVKRVWDRAEATFPSNTIIRLAEPVKLLNTPELRDDVRTFFAAHPIPQAAKVLDQILERLDVNTRLREREEARLGAFLLGRS
ncbi:MAG: M1 family metallopeptidase [Ilumatobacteraceae bacterium]